MVPAVPNMLAMALATPDPSQMPGSSIAFTPSAPWKVKGTRMNRTRQRMPEKKMALKVLVPGFVSWLV